MLRKEGRRRSWINPGATSETGRSRDHINNGRGLMLVKLRHKSLPPKYKNVSVSRNPVNQIHGVKVEVTQVTLHTQTGYLI